MKNRVKWGSKNYNMNKAYLLKIRIQINGQNKIIIQNRNTHPEFYIK